MGAGPDRVGHRRPGRGGAFALGGQLPHILRVLQVGGVGAGALHRIHQRLGIVQQRAGTLVVLIPGLALLVGREQRGPEGLQQGVGADIGIGVVDVCTGLVVAARVDMEVHPATGQAALGVLAVVPEVQSKDLLREPGKDLWFADRIQKKYPLAAENLRRRAERYNQGVAAAKNHEAKGRALIVAPDDTCGLETLSKDKDALKRFYEKGYQDAQVIPAFIKSC